MRQVGLHDSICETFVAYVLMLGQVALDMSMGQCQTAVAEAVQSFGRIDILFCCHSEVVVGTVEELSQNERTLSLVRDQFETVSVLLPSLEME